MKIQKNNIKIVRMISREIIPVYSIKTKIVSSKKDKLINKALLKEMKEVCDYKK